LRISSSANVRTASLASFFDTSIYLKPEQKALVAQMAKMRRRG
jgi:hypothetical protein